MKITKKLTESKDILTRLTEAEDEQDNIENTAEPESSVVENPSTASVAEIADSIIAATETGSNGELTVAPAEAEKVAAEAKQTADDINAGVIGSLWVENELTEVLDSALKVAKKLQRQNRTGNANVLVTGLPGSSKTAIVYEWAKRNGINIHYIDAKNNDLEADMNGYTLRDTTAGSDNKVAKAYSKVLDPLDRPNSVLFLDELNRQINPGIRASLLTLVNEKCVAGPDNTGRRYFNNLLFTIACINPAVPSDRGAAALNDAEKSRYVYSVEFDSTPSTALDYFKRHYTVQVSTLNPDDEYYEEDLQDYLQSLGLAIHLLSNVNFQFNTRDQLEDLSELQKNMLNQRSLTDAIVASGGDGKAFVKWVQERSDFLESTKTMLIDIMQSYDETDARAKAKRVIESTIQVLAKAGKADETAVNRVLNNLSGKRVATVAAEVTPNAENPEAEEAKASAGDDEDDFEDDTDLFQQNATGGRTAGTAASRRQAIATMQW